MINTAIVMSPIETAPSPGAGAAGKSRPDSSDFGAVLDSKIKDDQQQTREAKSVESDKAGRDSEPKAEAKNADEAEHASKDKSDKTHAKSDKPENKSDKTQAKSDKTQAKSEKAEAKSDKAEAKADATQAKPGDDIVIQQAKQADAGPAAEAATPVEPVVVQAQVVVAVAEQEVSADPVGSGAQGRTQADASAVKQAQPVGDIQVPVVKAQPVPEVAENAKNTVQSDVPTADAQPAPSGPTVTKQQVSEDAAYVGLTAKGLAQEALIETAAAGQSNSTDAVAREQVQEDSAPKAEAQSPKDLLGTKIDPQVANTAAQTKPVETQPQDVTIKPQVTAALRDEMTTLVVKAGISDGSSRMGGDLKGSTQNQTADQGAAFAIPGRTSFESVIRGLETTSTPQTVNTPQTETYTRVIDQVVQEIRLRLFQGQTDMTVKLNPAELGALRLHVSQTADGMTSQIQASSDHVKGLLQANLPTLIQSLSDAGLKMEHVTVTSGPSYNSLMHDHAPGTAYQQGNKSHQDNSKGSRDTGLDPAMINAAMDGVAPGGSVGYSWLA